MELSMPTKMILGLLPLAALGAVVVWLVYAIKLSEDINDDVVSAADRHFYRTSVSFQAVVATIALYFALHHGAGQM